MASTADGQIRTLGTKLLPKLRTAGTGVVLGLDASVTIAVRDLEHAEADLRPALRDPGLEGVVSVERGEELNG